MLYFYSGTDRKRAQIEMDKEIARVAKADARIVRITDTNSPADLAAALEGPGLFGEKRAIVLHGVCENIEMIDMFLNALKKIQESTEPFFVFEEKPLADTRRAIEKYAEKTYRFDAPKKAENKTVFELAYALRLADKKKLWVGYQRELANGNAPEAIHGVLFWGAKDMLMKSKEGTAEHTRAKKLVAELAELPHEARRNSFDLEYALERFVLSVA